MVKAELRYPLLRYSLLNYQCAPEQLEQQQLQQLEQAIAKAELIERKVAEHSQQVVDAAQLTAAQEELQAQFENSLEFEQALDWLQLTPELLKAGLVQALQAEAQLSLLRAQVTEPSEAEVARYFDAHPEKFQRPPQIKLRHILRTINDEYAENRREALLPWMQQHYAILSQQPERFIEMAELYSECPSAMQGGLIGYVSRGQLYPQLDAVAFTLAEGEVSQPVESPMGFHLLYCEGFREGAQRSFDEVKETIAQKLWQHQQKVAERSWIKSIL